MLLNNNSKEEVFVVDRTRTYVKICAFLIAQESKRTNTSTSLYCIEGVFINGNYLFIPYGAFEECVAKNKAYFDRIHIQDVVFLFGNSEIYDRLGFQIGYRIGEHWSCLSVRDLCKIDLSSIKVILKTTRQALELMGFPEELIDFKDFGALINSEALPLIALTETVKLFKFLYSPKTELAEGSLF